MDSKEKFDIYARMLRDWSQRMNLVAPSTLGDIENRHFADSAQLAEYLPKDAEIFDFGSGAGFPGVVLAILGWRVVCALSGLTDPCLWPGPRPRRRPPGSCRRPGRRR